MLRPLTLGLLAVLALASPAEAHSWTACSVIGILEPGSVHCAGADCVVTVRPEPLLPTTWLAVHESLAVSFSSKVTWTDRDRETPWPDLPSALAGLQGALVRVAGDLDNLEGHHMLFHTHRIVHLRAAPPPGGHPPVFGACGPPPWSEVTIAPRPPFKGPITRPRKRVWASGPSRACSRNRLLVMPTERWGEMFLAFAKAFGPPTHSAAHHPTAASMYTIPVAPTSDELLPTSSYGNAYCLWSIAREWIHCA
jgi:hypothetical protein